MTNNTDQRRRHRAVFLAFIMIVSVFGGAIAFSGSAAARAPGGAAGGNVSADNTSGAVVTGPGTTVDVANITFTQPGNISNVTVSLINGSNSEDVELADIQSVGVALRNTSTDSTNASAINNSVSDVDNINLSQFGTSAPSGNVTGIDQVVVNVTSLGNDGAIVNASFEAFENSSSSNFGAGDSTGLVTTENTQTLDGGIATESTVDANEDGTPSAPTVNVSFQSVSNINESSVNISLRNKNRTSNENVTGNTEITLVENGQLARSSASFTDNSNFTTSTNNTVFANISAPTIGEGFYSVNVSVNTSNGNPFTNNTLNNSQSNFTFDRVGDSLEVVTDSNNPIAGSQADIAVVAVDSDGNRLVLNDSNVGTSGSNIDFTFGDQASNATVTRSLGSADKPILNGSDQTFDAVAGINFSEVGNLTLTVSDLSGNFSQVSASQLYTASLGGVSVTVEDGEVSADGSETETVILQLTDGNGNEVPRSGTSASFGIVSGNAGSGDANATTNVVRSNTNSSGQSVAEINATNAGFDLTVQGSASGFSDTATVTTVPGNINDTNSQIAVGGNSDSLTATVNTTQSVNVSLRDAANNAVSGTEVSLSANVSGVSFEDSSPETNETGVAITDATLPTSAGDLQINATVGSFNASATGNATVNVTAQNASASTLQFASDSRSLAANSEDVGVSVEIVDQFGNINESITQDITLSSDDTGVFDFDGNAENSSAPANGAVDFNVDTAGSGTATLDASIPDADISNISAEFTATGADGIDVTINNDLSTSQNARQKATLTAQLTAGGDPISIQGETLNLARLDGSGAEINTSASAAGFSNNTDSSGIATFGINATNTEDDTNFEVSSQNFSAAGTVTITTAGSASSIDVAPANSTVSRNNTTTVTTTLVDQEGRTVPRSGVDITLTTVNGNGSITGANTNTTVFTADGVAQATFTYNASTSESSATLRGIGGGVSGTTTVTVEQQDQPDQPDEVTSEVNFNDNAAADGATSLTVDNATHDADFVIVAHTATDSDGDGDIQFNNANGNKEIGTKIGSSAIQSNGTQSNIEVNLSKNVSDGDNIDSLAADDDQQIVMMLHVANESGDTNFGGSVKEADGETPVFDNNFVNVSSLDGAAGNADSDGDGEIGDTEVQNAVRSFVVDGTLTREEVQDVIRAFIV